MRTFHIIQKPFLLKEIDFSIKSCIQEFNKYTSVRMNVKFWKGQELEEIISNL